jgi:PAS domain S-box-containing protein
MAFHDWPIRRKLTAVTMLTSITVLLLTATAFSVYYVESYRASLARNVSVQAAILANHSAAAVRTKDERAAREILAALAADPNMRQAAVYDLQGRLFARYPAESPSDTFPPEPKPPGPRLEGGGADCFTPILAGSTAVGTLYLKSDMGLLYVRLRFFALIALLVLCGAVLAALGISKLLQGHISTPILALAEMAKVISERGDFSVRAPGSSRDETGLLSKAFNDLLGRVQEAEQSRSFLAAIVESSDAAIAGKDLEGLVVSWNLGAERMFGFTAREIIGRPITCVLMPPDGEAEEQRILEEVKRGKLRQYDTVRRRKDGQAIEVSLIVSPIKDAQGKIIGVSSIAREVTQAKQAQRELQENRARLSAIIGSAMDAVISTDAAQRITMFNAAAERMFGLPAKEALGQPLDRLIPQRYREGHQKHVHEFGRTGATARAMGHLRPLSGLRANGEEFPIEASISQVELAGERIYTVILRDITERQQAQQALERQASVLREQAEMLDLANVLARDLGGHIVLWNTGMERMYGWTKAEALGKLSHELLRTEFPQPLKVVEETMLRQGQWGGELLHYRKDGSRMTVASQWVLHKDEQGRPVAILEVNTDITERKQAEEQIRLLNLDLEQRVEKRTEELTAANKELEAFTYSVAHDLRAPLRHIDAFTRIVHEEYSAGMAPEAKHYLENIRKGSRHMSQLVDDLLNLARVGRQELKRRPTPLDDLVREVVAELKSECQGREVEWRLEPLPSIECDPGLMKQVFANLLANAVKYTRPRPRAVIEVGCLKLPGSPALYVRDNGVGFNMKYVDKLFGVFQRLHRAEDFEGTGVGLATVERIVRKHGGCVWAEAAVDKGAIFYFTVSGLDKAVQSGQR